MSRQDFFCFFVYRFIPFGVIGMVLEPFPALYWYHSSALKVPWHLPLLPWSENLPLLTPDKNLMILKWVLFDGIWHIGRFENSVKGYKPILWENCVPCVVFTLTLKHTTHCCYQTTYSFSFPHFRNKNNHKNNNNHIFLYKWCHWWSYQ